MTSRPSSLREAAAIVAALACLLFWFAFGRVEEPEAAPRDSPAS